MSTLSNRTLQVFEGEEHNAMDTIPQQFSEVVMNFLHTNSSGSATGLPLRAVGSASKAGKCMAWSPHPMTCIYCPSLHQRFPMEMAASSGIIVFFIELGELSRTTSGYQKNNSP